MAMRERLRGLPVVGTALRVQDRYKRDAADQLAASIGLFGFLSLFPLIVLGVAVGGFVVRRTPGATLDVAATIREAIPGLEGLAGTSLETLVADVATNAGAILGVGAITLLLSGLRVVSAAMVATTRVFRRPEPVGWRAWTRRLVALSALGSLALLGAGAATLVGLETDVVPTPLRVVVGLAVSLGLDLVLFLVAYRLLSAGTGPSWRDLLPGAVLAGAGWTALKTFGATFVADQAARATDLYGTLGGIIALLLLFYLAGRLYLYGAETSAVLRGIGAGEDPDGASRRPADGREGGGPARPPLPDDARHDPVDLEPKGPLPADPHVHVHRPPAPTADEPAPTVSPQTRARLAGADGGADRRPDVRGAIAFLLAVGAVAGLAYALKPWED